MSGSSATSERGATLMLCKTTKPVQTFSVNADVFIPAYRVIDGQSSKDIKIQINSWEDNKQLQFTSMPTGTYFMVLTMGGGTFVVKNYVVYNERINNDLQLPAF